MTRLAILWHMHQPYYEDLATGEHILPWVRLHAIKDYWGMGNLLREFPGVRVTFNLVPSLLIQIQAFAEDRARDRHLRVGLTPADALDPDDRAFLVANSFHVPVDRMIRPFPRYAELYERRQAPDVFTTDDLRDLQVLHKLAWMDPDWLQRDSRLLLLAGKARDYTEADKAVLREVERELLDAVIPLYRELGSIGRVELSTSPFYHPILPLLCDTDVHLRAHPQSAIPRHVFSRRQDAGDQLDRAMRVHRELFGATPAGVWPSEGSVSDEVIGLLAERHTRWTATDEEILVRSLRQPATADVLYRPYEIGVDGQTVRILFRDHALSDLIGFAYQSWDAATAADDFIGKVRDAGRRFDVLQMAAGAPSAENGGEVATVTVILDGENAWEHYPGGGRPFLRALYQRLSEAPDIQTVTMAEAASGPARRLETLFPGSWINGDFYIWAGHPDDHRAWAQLAAARATFDRLVPHVSEEQRVWAWDELMIAEGSDWFWWYGDDHSSDHDREFDDLFRRHLRNVYRALGQSAPTELHVTNITTETSRIRLHTLSTPDLDGRATHFGEWAGSVPVSLRTGGGTMHQVADHLTRELRIAADGAALFIRLDGPEVISRLNAGEILVALIIDRPRQVRLEVSAGGRGARWIASEIVEITIPFSTLGLTAGDALSFYVLISAADGHILERQPSHDAIELEVPSEDLDAVNWRI